MTRTQGKMLDACESYGRAPGVAGEYDPRPTRADRERVEPRRRFAKGSINDPSGYVDPFTGEYRRYGQ
jgi:hypothetical protein